jgi:cytochrome P450 family 142 subfamily A polypeptide 1
MRHPDQRQKLIDDLSLIPSAVEECLRWVTPVINMARTATTDVQIRDKTIPEGDQVLLMYASANRDERVFAEPQRFDVTRTPNPHVTFGHSAHFCLGASLARLEIKVMLEEVLQRLPDMQVAELDAPVKRTHSSFIRGITALPVMF